MREKANRDVREAAKAANAPIWAIGARIGVSEATITRWLRQELPADKKAEIMEAINTIAAM